MSLIDGIKKLAIRLTGTQARVNVVPLHFVFDDKIEILVKVQVHEEGFEIRGAYLLVRGVCETTVIDTNNAGEPGVARLEREEFYQQKIDFSGMKAFEAREVCTFKINFELGLGARDFSSEAGSKVYYELLAGLDVFGNDPGSSWIVVSQPVKNQRRLK